MQGEPLMHHSLYAEPWLNELREQFVAAGHDHERVDRHIGESMARYRDRRTPDVLPLLIERYVNRELRDQASPHSAGSKAGAEPRPRPT
jgi:hypothetical protein